MSNYDSWKLQEPPEYREQDDSYAGREESEDEHRARIEQERLQAEAQRQQRMPWAPEPSASSALRIMAEACDAVLR